MKVDLKNYELLYFVDENGDVYSYPKKTRKNIRKLKAMIGNNGYSSVDLCKDGTIKKYLIHRLVAEAFIPNPEKKPQVNHINGIKTDNRLDNLEWCTHSENMLHSYKQGLNTTKGEKNSQSKLNTEDVVKIFLDDRMYSLISKQYNISISTISDIKRGYSWTHITKMKNIKKKE
jgi:uncharacterized protein YerC